MLELQNRILRSFAHIFYSILITKPIGTLDGVVHMPTPIIRAHITKRSRDATLSSHSMATSWKNLADTGCRKAFFCHTKCSAKTGATCSYNDNIMMMFYDFIL